MTTEIEITLKDGVQLIRLARPEKKNALTGAMYDAMSAALDRGETDDEIAVHVFIGSGGSFSAGNDINDFARRSSTPSGGIPTPSLSFIRRLPVTTKPMIAAVDGLAVGIGTTMLLHCDLVYVSPTASLRTPFLDLGVVPEAASSLLIPQRAGYVRAFELLCLGQPCDAEAAVRAGLANAVVPQDQLEATALAAARRLADKPRDALMLSRRLLRGDNGAIVKRLEEEAAIFGERLTSPEAKEAFAAFFEKRAPDFRKLRGAGKA
ncbi:MAG: enoyl-CoA hydratase/isomerase family protein [Hyphomicrobiaceae bacterium]|nr:enoyl-CoA hydratase/isomerase family protein [Hyphomicrobiaceae bacterium]